MAKTRVLQIRFTVEEWKRLKEAAKRDYLLPGTWGRRELLKVVDAKEDEGVQNG